MSSTPQEGHEEEMSEYGLGRLSAPDARDRQYLMRAMLLDTPPVLPAYRYYRTGAVLDQGSTPQCVGYSWRQWLSSALLMTKGGPDAATLYHQAQTVDEWEGEGYAGTSVRAGAKVLQRLGHISTYFWAYDAKTIADFILSGNGGVVIGINWYRSMFMPDPKTGIIRPSGQLMGGHAIYVSGYNRVQGQFRLLNSWGRRYGHNGRVWLSGEDMDRLIKEDGEACAATQQIPA